MGNISTANESSHEALELYFKKYPDVPKETILKQHLLSLGHWFSDAALEATTGALVKSYRLFSYDLVPMSEFKRALRSTQRALRHAPRIDSNFAFSLLSLPD